MLIDITGPCLWLVGALIALSLTATLLSAAVIITAMAWGREISSMHLDIVSSLNEISYRVDKILIRWEKEDGVPVANGETQR